MVKLIVGVLTYNLEKYVGQALDSILAQKTNFDFKIIVVDDFSTDKTRTILQKYALQYPEKIEVILKEKNEGCLAASNVLFSYVKSPYFAFLDGDDFWLDENHLQNGVDFLEKNIDYSMYGNNTYLYIDNKFQNKIVHKSKVNNTFELLDFFKEECPFVHTSAIVYRNAIFKEGVPKSFIDNVTTPFNSVFRGEDYRFLLLLMNGKIYISDNLVSAYRIHSQGIWTSSSNFKRNYEMLLFRYYLYANFPMYKDQIELMFLKSYNKFMHFLIDDNDLINKFNFTKKEFDDLSFLLSLIHKDNSINWNKAKCASPKNIKYKIYIWLYRKLYKKLTSKRYI